MAKCAVVTWGSCTGPAREAVARARGDGLAVQLVALRLLAPAQPDRLAAALAGVRRVLVVEQSHSGQFYRYLRAEHALGAEHAARCAIRDRCRCGPARSSTSLCAGAANERRPAVAALAAKDFKSATKPVWCPGCGDYGVLTSLAKRARRSGPAP